MATTTALAVKTVEAPSRRGPTAGPSRDYSIKELRDQERAIVEQQEHAYEVLVAHWQLHKPARQC